MLKHNKLIDVMINTAFLKEEHCVKYLQAIYHWLAIT